MARFLDNSVRGIALAALGWLSSAGALAQAPGARIPFESWAPLGDYERTAFAEEGALRIVVPTKQRDVEIAFTPQELRAAGYGAEQVDTRGVRRGAEPPRFTAYTGRIVANAGRDFAKLGYSADRGRLEGLLRIDDAFYALEADLAEGDYVIDVREVTAEEIAALARSCAVSSDELTQLEPSSWTASSAQPLAATVLREIELGTEADALLVSQAGGAAPANSRILSLVNMVNGIYETDLGLTNRVVEQRAHVGSDPYTSTDPGELLDQFRALGLRSFSTGFDDAMLFTGRELDGSTVGIAFLESACTSARFGVAQLFRQGDFYAGLLTAHELGHTLGARHTSDGIMTSSLTGAAYFSPASQDEIAAYTASVACLTLAAGSGSNQAPTLEPVGPQTVIEGQTLWLQLEASDPDGDPIRYDANPLPLGASLTPSGLFSWTPSRTAAGCNGSSQTTIQFTASDGFLSASESVPFSVSDVNTGASPAFSDPADRSVYAGQLVQFQLQASDADGDSIAFSSSDLPAGATLSASGGFSWRPSSEQVGVVDVEFTATDCTGLSASQSASLSVSVQPVPHLTGITPNTGWMRQTVTITGEALLGNQVQVRFRKKSATIVSLSDTSVSVVVPKIKKKHRKRGFQPVTLIRDGVTADNVVLFDYVKP